LTDVWDDVVTALLGRVSSDREDAGAQHHRYTVLKTSPLRLRELGGDEILDDADDDVEVSRAVRRADPALATGDVVIVREDRDGYVVTEILDDA
jgi:hypothetical protein